MEDFIKNLIREVVWQQITNDFYNFVIKHSETLSPKEQIVLAELINNGDDYSHGILEQLWKEFEVEGCSVKRIQELYEIEMKKMGAINI